MKKLFFYQNPIQWSWLVPWLCYCRRLGVPLVLVGGCIRDWLLSRRVVEIDAVALLSNFHPEALSKALIHFLPETKGPYILKGTKDVRYHYVHHGLGLSFDILPLRGNTLKEDLRLRDFTINACIGLPGQNQALVIHDPLGLGIKDLTEKKIMTPKDPLATLLDDPIRSIRALRLCHTLDFTLEPWFQATIRESLAKGILKRVSIERVRQELERILMDCSIELERLVMDIRMLGLDKALAAMLAVSYENGRSPTSKRTTLTFQALPMLPWLRMGVLLRLLFGEGEVPERGLLLLGYAKKRVRLFRRILDKTLKSF